MTKKAQALGEAKLKSSGLTTKDAKLLGFEFLEGKQTQALHPAFKPLCSLLIPYFGPDGNPISDWPKRDPFYRLRYLEVPTDFDAVAAKKSPRYVQEPDTAPVAYYPRNQDWKSLAKDPSKPIIITEGEFKAAKACKEGFPTLGLGGVWNWRSLGKGVTWLPSLEPIKWDKRYVYVCFDSDMRTKPDVCQALKLLSDQLVERGAYPHVVSLPDIKGLPKVGLDDYLVNTRDGAKQFAELLSKADAVGLTEALWAINEKYIYVEEPGLVLNQHTMAKVNPSSWRDHGKAATKSYQQAVVRTNGTIAREPVSAAAAWLKWPLRREALRLTYKPGAPRELETGEYNIWPGWGVEPKKGDVRPFLKLVEHLFSGAEPEALEWFLRWCAHPLQHPGTKLFTSVVMHGIRHGTGKSFIGYTLGRIYGKNFTEISHMDLHNHFNEWAEGKQLVMGDDVTGSNKRADADFLKKLITQRELRVNGKYVPTYVVPDCVNYFFTANHPDSFFLEDDDRRFFVHEVTVGALPEKFYREYEAWLDAGGAAHVFQHLLDMDLRAFNPAAPAFRTAAKERMIATVQSDLAGWVRTLVQSPGQVLKVGEVSILKDLYTSKELLDLYDPTSRTGTTANGLGRELMRAGIRQVCAGRPVRISSGHLARYYAVRNADKWLTAQPAAVAKHVESWTGEPPKKPAAY